MAYTEQQFFEAIQSAKDEINHKTKETNSYIRGYNDCFAFLVAYERYLRKDKSRCYLLPFQSSYSDHKDFMKKLSVEGYASLDMLSKVMLFEPVKDRVPQTGDIAYEERRSFGSAMIAEKDYWVSSKEDCSGIYNYRKVLFKELRPILLARPVYI